jgi:hypothetical protein
MDYNNNSGGLAVIRGRNVDNGHARQAEQADETGYTGTVCVWEPFLY